MAYIQPGGTFDVATSYVIYLYIQPPYTCWEKWRLYMQNIQPPPPFEMYRVCNIYIIIYMPYTELTLQTIFDSNNELDEQKM